MPIIKVEKQYNNPELIQQMKVNNTADRMTYLPDNIHPNAGGYDLITPYVSKWMKEVLAA